MKAIKSINELQSAFSSQNSRWQEIIYDENDPLNVKIGIYTIKATPTANNDKYEYALEYWDFSNVSIITEDITIYESVPEIRQYLFDNIKSIIAAAYKDFQNEKKDTSN